MIHSLDVIGRHPRRAALIGLGLSWAGIGYWWAAIPTRSRELGIDWSPLLTQGICAAIWMIAGMIALGAGIAGRWFRAGFTALQASALFMTLVFTVAALLVVIPESVIPGGGERAIVTATSYAALWWAAVISAQVRGVDE